MMRRKRRVWRRRTIRRRIRIVMVLLVIALAMGGLLLLLRGGKPPVDPVLAMRRATTALEVGNYHAAHDQARQAAVAAPRSGRVQLMLARTSLLLGDAITAEAALDRALADGVPLSATLADRVEARLLLDNLEGAQDAVDQMPTQRDAAMTRAAAQLAAAEGGGGAALRQSLEQLVVRFPNDARAWADLGRSRFGAGDMDGASRAAARAARLAPADPIALTLRGEVVRARYGLAAGLPWFEAALGRDAYYHPALIQYAATLGDLGRASEALAATRMALVSEPGSPEAYYLQAVIAARAGRFALAQQALELTGGALNARPSVALLEGALAYAQGRPQRALRAWGRLVAMQPMNVAARQLLAAAQVAAGDRPAALVTLRPILSRADADGYALRLAALAAGPDNGALLDRVASGRRGDAAIFLADRPVIDLAIAADDAPTDPTYALGLIRGLVSSGNRAGALQWAQSLVRASPGAPAAQMAYGDMLATGGRIAEAVVPYARAADLTFDEPTMLRLTDAYQRTGRARDAAVSLGLYLSQNPQGIAARRLLARWQLAAGQWDAAIETLEGLRNQLGLRDVALLHGLAIAYARSGDGVVARRYGAAAYRLAPMNAGVADAYGQALAADGEKDGAQQLFDKVHALRPDFTPSATPR
ncbi:tetratricopeptide repeat protein [Sphingomonas sp. CFBP8993]|uniref:tetratricopeptide repeat protein n=1 Tax=Sphingomonas sp. CFBP8993 TaxID=3096526 RepID=UPI002A6AA35D|nr:tetratricopeptide repeat protein [Sphingomonas sp. CFBP8993]MDY0960254.1 tetratricopeptide repeat protein [Sphingomonas sp. CFBP8993]